MSESIILLVVLIAIPLAILAGLAVILERTGKV